MKLGMTNILCTKIY